MESDSITTHNLGRMGQMHRLCQQGPELRADYVLTGEATKSLNENRESKTRGHQYMSACIDPH